LLSIVHIDTLNASRLIDDALKEPANGFRGEGTTVIGRHVSHNFDFALGGIGIETHGEFDLSNFHRARGSIIQEFDKVDVNIVDFLSPNIEFIHCEVSPRMNEVIG
jgi:hypothetical protein